MEDDALLAASTLKRLNPRQYFAHFIRHNVRPDGRSFLEFRERAKNEDSISTANSSALVRKGDTTVLCAIKAEIGDVEVGREGEGWIVPNVDLPAMSSSRFRPGPPSEEAQLLSYRLRTLLLTHPIVPLESLLIEYAKACWVIYIDVLCINYDGNIWDAVIESVWSSLSSLKLPKTTWDLDSKSALYDSSEPPVPLSLTIKSLSSSTFAVYEDPSSVPEIPPILLADPTDFEAQLCSTSMTIVAVVDLDGRKRLRHAYFQGSFKQEMRLLCIDLAIKRLSEC